MVDQSDVGRRLRERRTSVGATVEETARSAHVDPGYLEYLETDADPHPSPEVIARLATALGTTSKLLHGAGQDLPPGRAGGRSGADLLALTEVECGALIAPGGVGRFVYVEPRGPVAIPVNYRMLDGQPVFRTAEETAAVRRAVGHRGSLQVDRLDDALTEGWSVLVSGIVHRLSDPGALGRAQRVGVEPWAGGHRHTWLLIEPEMITGRRIRHGRTSSGGR